MANSSDLAVELRAAKSVAAALGLAFALVLAGAWSAAAADPLPSWKEGPTKQRLLAFVAGVVDEAADSYVAPADRIATFDNDGTLWVEKPTYVQAFFVFERVRELAPDHPEWKTTQPYQAVLENDMQRLGALEVPELLELLQATHSGMSQRAFQKQVDDFFAEARHPRWKRPFQELIYQPQLELMAHLRANGFRVFIATGGGRDFVRQVSEQVYDVPRHMVVGSALQTRFEMTEQGPLLQRLPEIVKPLDDKAGKPVQIERDIGRVPILTVGNSDGDLQMLQYSTRNEGALQVLVHHDDAKREYAYDTGTEEALEVARGQGWLVVSMKRDFARVFPFDAK